MSVSTWNIMAGIMSLLLISGMGLLLVPIVVDIRMHRRQTIDFASFFKHKRSFIVRYPLWYMVSSGLVAAASMVVALLMIEIEEYASYATLMASWMALLTIANVAMATAKHHNKDLSLFQEYHRVIDESFANKDKAQQNIDELRAQEQALLLHIESIEHTFRLEEGRLTLGSELAKTLQPLRDWIRQNIDIINGFDLTMKDAFNHDLHIYLETGKTIQIDRSVFQAMNKDRNAELEQEARLEQRNLTYRHSIRIIETKTLLSNRDLNNVAQLLWRLGATFEDAMTAAILSFVDLHPEGRMEMLGAVYEHGIITPVALEKSIIAQDREWFFDKAYLGRYAEDGHREIAISCIHHNAKHSSFRWLANVGALSRQTIESVLRETDARNEARAYFLSYRDVFQYDIRYYEEATKYENECVAIRQYHLEHANSDQTFRTIEEIVQAKTFDENKSWIHEEYLACIGKLDQTIGSLLSTLFLFRSSKAFHSPRFEAVKLLSLYSEYRKNLFERDLVILERFLHTLILEMETDARITTAAISILHQYHSAVFSNTKDRLNLQMNPSEIERKLKISLKTDGQFSLLKRIVARTEHSRQALDLL